MDFSQVKAITIPEGNVIRILSGATVLWERTGLPAEYQEVEYLESTGTQYIDTGVVLNNGCVITLDFLMAESSVNRIAYGWRRKGTYTGLYQAYITSNTSKIRSIVVGRSANDTYPQSFEYGVRNKVLIDSVNKQVLVNDTVIDCGANFNNGRAFDENGSSEYHPYLFALNNAGRAVAISEDTRIYGYSVQYEGELLQSFVPCYRKIDKVAGMYDVANGVFYTNAGTGEFNVGADVIVLPADYQRVGYIQSSGTQYIDTGVKVSTNNKITMDLQFTDATYQQINGGYYIYRVSGTSYTIRNDIGVGSTGMFFMGASSTSITTNVTADTNRHIFMIDATTGEWSIDDAGGSVPPVTHSDYEVTLLIGARSGRNVSGRVLAPATYCEEKIYNVKIYTSGNLVKDFIPCYRKIDNVAGLYDVVNDVFYSNSGSGSFTAGPII